MRQRRVVLPLVVLLCGTLLEGCYLVPQEDTDCSPPTIGIDPSTVHVGDEITVELSSWDDYDPQCRLARPEGSRLSIFLEPDTGEEEKTITLPQVTVDTDRQQSIRVPIPASMAPDRYSLWVEYSEKEPLTIEKAHHA